MKSRAQPQTRPGVEPRKPGAGHVTAILVGAALILGGAVRLIPVLTASFPINDGGLFYVMATEVQQNHYGIPVYTAYNNDRIPFAYPPLGFYITAALSDLFGWPILDIVRVLPGVLCTLTLPAFYALARTILGSNTRAVTALFAFALLPQAVIWLIMGGGLTRALGVLLTLLTLLFAYRMYTLKDGRAIVLTSIFASLTVLSHPEVSVFAATSVLVFFAFLGRHRFGVVSSVTIALGTLALTSPWWLTVLLRHGLSPFLGASQNGAHSWLSWLGIFQFDFAGESFLALVSVTGLLGLMSCLVERKFFLPGWLVAIFVTTPRTSGEYGTIPLAIMAAIGLYRVVLPGLLGIVGWKQDTLGALEKQTSRLVLYYGIGYLVVAMIYSLAIGSGLVKSLPVAEREAMDWARRNTPLDSKFLVLTAYESSDDRTSEWFPVLTGRTSLATVQGYEWLPGQFSQRWNRYFELQGCGRSEVACLDEWSKKTQQPYTHLYIRSSGNDLAATCCPALALSAGESRDLILIYDGPGALIYAKQGGS